MRAMRHRSPRLVRSTPLLVLLIGIGPKLTTATTVAVLLMVLGELLRTLLHFTIGSLSIAGGVILLVLAVWIVLSPPDGSSRSTAGKGPDAAGPVPSGRAIPAQPGGIVSLMTISAEAKSLSVFAVESSILMFVLLIDVAVFRWANRVSEKINEGRMLVTEKVFGLLIAAIAVQLILDGWSR
jgi:multiple antibiotic resistance protein